MESAGSGLVAGISLAMDINGQGCLDLPSFTALGAMGKHVSTPNAQFQPMNCSFGLIDPLPPVPGQKPIRKKQERYEAVSRRSLEYIAAVSGKTGGK